MRLHRFYVPHGIDLGGTNTLSDPSLIHQLRSVFRLHEGDGLIFFDGSGTDYVSEIVSLTKAQCTFRVNETYNVKPTSRMKLILAPSLIKKDNLEWVIQKGTELGVSGFAPVVSERSEKKGFNGERARKIMIEACEQSGRSDLPEISEPQSLADFLDDRDGEVIAFHMDGKPFDAQGLASVKCVTALVGPEGGWSEREVELFKEKNVTVVKLATPVLRAETAAVAVAAMLLG